MPKFNLIFGVFVLGALSAGNPIYDGKDVGTVKKVGKNTIVSGQRLFPFLASITINADGMVHPESCAGVIIGKTTILTVAHCLDGKKNPKIYVHVGVVDLIWEEEFGQKVRVSNYITHDLYKKRCFIGNQKYCIGVNDIAILWLEKELIFGPKVKRAELSFNKNPPIGKSGTILGWGETSKAVLPSMLQQGRMKVMSKADCRNFNKNAYITENVLCLTAVKGRTKASHGDSGGPFVIEGFVYGLSSHGLFKDLSFKESIDVYTFIPNYLDWISRNVRAGPPKSKNN